MAQRSRISADPNLIRSTQDYLKNRNQTYLKMALSAPGIIAENVSGGTGETPQAQWDRWMGAKPPALSPQEALQFKMQIRQQMEDIEAAKAKARTDAAATFLNPKPELLLKAMDMVGGLVESKMGANASIYRQKIQNDVDNATKLVQDMERRRLDQAMLSGGDGETGVVVSGDPKRAGEAATKLAESLPAQALGDMNQGVIQEIVAATAGFTDAELMKFAYEFNNRMMERGVPTRFEDVLAAPQGGMNAAEAAALQNRFQRAKQNMQPLLQSINEDANIILAKTFKQVTGPDQFVGMGAPGQEVARLFQDMFGGEVSMTDLIFGETDPEALEQKIDAILPGEDGQRPEDDWVEMLDYIDKNSQVNPTIRQIRDQIWNSPEFAQFMQKHGFPPEAKAEAWRALRFEARKRKQEAKREGREKLREIRRGTYTEPAEPTDAAQLIGGGPGEDASTGGSTTDPFEKAKADASEGKMEGYKVFLKDDMTAVLITPEGRHIEGKDGDKAFEALIAALPEDAVVWDLPPEVKPEEGGEGAPPTGMAKAPEAAEVEDPEVPTSKLPGQIPETTPTLAKSGAPKPAPQPKARPTEVESALKGAEDALAMGSPVPKDIEVKKKSFLKKMLTGG